MKRENDNTSQEPLSKRVKINSAAEDNLLSNAVYLEDSSTIEILVQNGSSLDGKYGEHGNTLAHLAAYWGKKEIFKKLLDLGLDIKTPNNEGINVVQAALRCGQKEIVEFLVKEKEINPTHALHYVVDYDNSEMFPIHIVDKGKSEMISKLLELGADIHGTMAEDGAQPIHRAVLKKNLPMVIILLANGADIAAKTKNDSTVLHLAAKAQWLEGIAPLLQFKNINVNSQDSSGHTMLSYVIGKKSADNYIAILKKSVVEQLLNAGALWDIKANNGNTPLDIAIMTNEIAIVDKEKKLVLFQKIIAEGDLNRVKKLFWHLKSYSAASTAKYHLKLMQYAIEIEQKNIFEYFEAQGVDIHVKDEDGSTLLHRAAQLGKKEIFEYLAKKGLDISCVNKNNSTVLHVAAYHNQQEMIDYLINHCDFDPATPGKQGKTILHYAISQGLEKLAGHLVVKHQLDVDFPDEYGITPLHLAINGKHHNLIELLIKHGANINLLDSYKNTPLDLAINANDSEAVKLLVKYGGNIMKVTPNPAWSPEVVLYMNIQKTLKQITTIYGHNNTINISVLQVLDESELEIFIKNSMKSYFSEGGAPEYYLNYCKSLNISENLKKIIVSCFEDLTKEKDAELGFLECALLEIYHGISPMPPETLLSLLEATSTPKENSALLAFYDQNKQYKIAGNFLIEVAESNSEVPSLSALDYLMMTRNDIQKNVKGLKTCALPAELNYLIKETINKFNSNIKNPLLVQLFKLKEEVESKNIKLQVNESELLEQRKEIEKLKANQTKMEKMLQFCKSLPGFSELINSQNPEDISEDISALLGGIDHTDTISI